MIRDLRQQVILQIKTAFLNWQSSVKQIQRAKARGALRLPRSGAARTGAEALRSGTIQHRGSWSDAQIGIYTFDDADYANALSGNYSLRPRPRLTTRPAAYLLMCRPVSAI